MAYHYVNTMTLTKMESALKGRDYHFDIVDYVVFASMLVLSALTGIYYGCRSRYCKHAQEQTLRDYLTGSGTMRCFPVAMSLVASYISGVTILGTPAEIYNFGTQYFLIVIAICCSGLVVATVYLPVFFKLQVHSSYEYLELRFNRTVRTIASVFFVLDEIMFLPILIYVPSLAFNQVTGMNVHLIGTIVCVVCIFYTVLGGLRAVIWTDTWQIIVMFISVIVVVGLGTYQVGGPSVIFSTSKQGERLRFFNFSPSLYERYSVFSVVIGGFSYWTSFNAVNQTMVQRYLSLPTERLSKISVALFTGGVSLFVAVCCFSGILVYATYYGCDPLTSGRIKADDQLLPLFVMETVGHLRGVPGLFIAGVFGAALSSLSVVLNSTSNVFLEDFLRGCMRMSFSERISKFIVKGVILVLGVLAVAFLFVVEHMGGVLQMAASLSSIAAGTTFGIFSLGMLVPWANSTGAIFGAIFGAVVSGVVSYGGQYVNAAKLVVPHKLPLYVDQCFDKYGIVTNATEVVYPDESTVFPLFRVSYQWITLIGSTTVILTGIIVTLFTGKRDLKVIDPQLISPVLHFMLPEECQVYAGSALKKARRKLHNEELVMPEKISVVKITSSGDTLDSSSKDEDEQRF